MMGCRNVKRLQSNVCKTYILKIRSYTTKLALCFHKNYDGSDGMRKMTIAITTINLSQGEGGGKQLDHTMILTSCEGTQHPRCKSPILFFK